MAERRTVEVRIEFDEDEEKLPSGDEIVDQIHNDLLEVGTQNVTTSLIKEFTE